MKKVDYSMKHAATTAEQSTERKSCMRIYFCGSGLSRDTQWPQKIAGEPAPTSENVIA